LGESGAFAGPDGCNQMVSLIGERGEVSPISICSTNFVITF
jgi:hypothetical protein